MLFLLACTGTSDTALSEPAAGPDIEVSPMTSDLGTVVAGDSAYANLTIANRGREDLTVTGSSSTTDLFGPGEEIIPTPFYILPGGELTLILPVGPFPASGSFSGEVTIYSDDPDEPAVTVTVQGEVGG